MSTSVVVPYVGEGRPSFTLAAVCARIPGRINAETEAQQHAAQANAYLDALGWVLRGLSSRRSRSA